MQLPSQNLLAWKISVTLLQFLAIGTTIFRLVRRWRSQRMWWDDYVVCIPVALDCLYVTVLWIKFQHKVVKPNATLDSFWFNAFLYYSVLWPVRVSLALTLARIFPPRHRARQYSIGFAISFVIAYIGSLAFIMVTCRSATAWYRIRLEYCLKTKNGMYPGNVSILILDALSDILLISLPLYVLWHIKLPISQRRLILSLFSSSVLSLFGTLAVLVVWYGGMSPGPDYGIITTMVAYMETGLSLLACNLLVVVTAFYQYWRGRNNSNDHLESNSTPRGPRSETIGSSRPVVSSQLDISFTVVYQDEVGASTYSRAPISSISSPQA
ncbi:hypothetical protein BYT27DRAFT_6636398 [Phlegmacium glaucopus]|nr:hypothetical protein BYT27DRAFT_6636398 [Phlegmacium glaucopus]